MADFCALSRLINAMSLRLKFIHSKIPVWLQYVGVATAGAASFVVALQIGSPDIPLVVGIELRENTTAHAPDAVVSSHPSSQPALPLAQDSHAERLDAGILQNPFAPLNLLANINQPEPSSVSNVPLTQVKQLVKRQPKVHLPPVAPMPLPTPVIPPSQPPTLEPPTLPFIVLGMIQGPRIATGSAVAFLQDRGNLIVVHAGDEINKLYRVQSISEDKIEMVYLPLNKTQILAIVH